jgi:hypothetical protein
MNEYLFVIGHIFFLTIGTHAMSKLSLRVLFDILFDSVPVALVVTDFFTPGADGNQLA